MSYKCLTLFSCAYVCRVELYSRLSRQLVSPWDFLVSNPPYVTSDEMQQLEPEIIR